MHLQGCGCSIRLTVSRGQDLAGVLDVRPRLLVAHELDIIQAEIQLAASRPWMVRPVALAELAPEGCVQIERLLGGSRVAMTHRDGVAR